MEFSVTKVVGIYLRSSFARVRALCHITTTSFGLGDQDAAWSPFPHPVDYFSCAPSVNSQ